MCTVPMEDGIAKATLNRMVKSSENDMAAARLGAAHGAARGHDD